MTDIEKILKENKFDFAEYQIEQDDSMIMLKKSTLKTIIESELKKLRVADVIQQSEQFFCCVVENGQPKCEKQCQFCKD